MKNVCPKRVNGIFFEVVQLELYSQTDITGTDEALKTGKEAQ